MIIIECIPKGILNHGINQSALALARPCHTVSVTALRKSKRSHGHVLHTACNNHIGIACHDHLCSLVYAVKTGTAYNVSGYSGNFYRKTCLDRSLSCNVLSQTCLDNASHIYVLNIFRFDTCSCDRFLDHDGA